MADYLREALLMKWKMLNVFYNCRLGSRYKSDGSVFSSFKTLESRRTKHRTFLFCTSIKYHASERLKNVVLETIEVQGLALKNFRFQSPTAPPVCPTNTQATAVCIPCSSHSINLVGYSSGVMWRCEEVFVFFRNWTHCIGIYTSMECAEITTAAKENYTRHWLCRVRDELRYDLHFVNSEHLISSQFHTALLHYW
jgi:hypothetical protein